MSSKSKKIIISTIISLAIIIIVLNYVSSEFFSLRYWNPIKRVYIKNILIKAEVVKSREKIEKGLLGREGLGEGRGMLFAMPSEEVQHFWTRGMNFPIDIIWIEDNVVIGCEQQLTPQDQRIFSSPGEAGMALEVPAGFCSNYGIRSNDSVRIE